MKLTIVGTGYVGIVTGIGLANLGNDVICVDVDQKKIDMLSNGKLTLYEPGLEEIFLRNFKSGRLQFTADLKKGVRESEIIFICVGTPCNEANEADLTAGRVVPHESVLAARTRGEEHVQVSVPVEVGEDPCAGSAGQPRRAGCACEVSRAVVHEQAPVHQQIGVAVPVHVTEGCAAAAEGLGDGVGVRKQGQGLATPEAPLHRGRTCRDVAR